MFRAYFHLSMELVRDVVRALEEEMIANFNDASDKPVSSVFTAPIPSQTATRDPGWAKRAAGGEGGGEGLSDASPPGQCVAAGAPKKEKVVAMLESISDEAIDELVEAAFEGADRDADGRLSFEEFKQWAAADSTMVSWFDSLGSVF